MESIWQKEVTLQKREAFTGKRHVQAAVIGAGIAGILTAYFLQEQGVEAIVLEADQIGSGQTGRTTAKITAQHGLKYHNLAKKIGRKRAKLYAGAQQEAIRLYQEIIRKEHISCDFKYLPAYLYTRNLQAVKKLQKEAEEAKRLGIDASFLDGSKEDLGSRLGLPFRVEGAVRFEEQAQFHPLFFLKALAEKLEIYENTRVLSVKNKKLMTERGEIEAEYIIFASHYPFPIVPGFYFFRQHQERSYVLALPKREPLPGMYYSIDKDGLSLRSSGAYLLLGGGGHRTGAKRTGGSYRFLEEAAKAYWADAHHGEALTEWSAQDSMPHDGIPFIGKFSVFRPDWYVATGFQKWGMTSAILAAWMISDSIAGKENPYERLFSPRRFLPLAGGGRLLADIGKNAAGLAKGLFHKRRCSHMGCKLVYNPDENSWDCPCHGSRYDHEGELLDGPAQKDALFRTKGLINKG